MIPALQPNVGTPTPLPTLPSNLKILFLGVDSVLSGNRQGTGDSLSKSSPSMTLTDAAGNFTSADIGSTITLSGCPSSQNNTTSLITAVPSSTQITFTNSAGVAEAIPSATWRINGRITSITDRLAGIVATPNSGNGIVADVTSEANGKVRMASYIASATAQNNQGSDVGGLIASLGTRNMALYMYGQREQQVTSINFSLLNSGDTHHIRAVFASTNIMRMQRNNGSNNSTNIVTSASIATTSLFSWCWTWDNAGSALMQAFRSATSLGAPVAPSSAQRPTDLDRIRLGSGTTGEGFSARAIGVFNDLPSTSDQSQVDAYVNFFYA